MDPRISAVAGVSVPEPIAHGAGPPAPEAHCSGSWFPARNRAAGTRARCASCGREVSITPPPPDPTHDPWWGARVNRFAPHCAAPEPGRTEGGGGKGRKG